jgi:hypothetical protein
LYRMFLIQQGFSDYDIASKFMISLENQISGLHTFSTRQIMTIIKLASKLKEKMAIEIDQMALYLSLKTYLGSILPLEKIDICLEKCVPDACRQDENLQDFSRKETLKDMLKWGFHVIVSGQPCSGKTRFIKEAAEEISIPLSYISATGQGIQNILGAETVEGAKGIVEELISSTFGCI